MAGENIKITHDASEKGTLVLHIDGDIDAHTTKVLQKYVGDLFAQGKYKLIFDVSKVNYMSSAGASLFIVILNEAKENAGNMVIMNIQPGVKNVFDLLGLSPMFLIVENMRTALSAFQ
jgi:anti-sigma B factor antagonist